jgi:hypothetical protein
LRWNAPDECPDDVDVMHAIEGFLGEPLTDVHQQDLAISASVSAAKSGFTAQLRFKGAAGVENRSLEHPECEKLMEAVALLVALAIDPERVKARQATVEEAKREPTPVPEAPAAPLSAVEADPDPQPAPPHPASEVEQTPLALPAPSGASSERPLGLGQPFSEQLEVFGVAASGLLPMVGPGLGASIGLRRGRFELGLVGNYFLPRTDEVAASPRAGIQLSLWTVGARACALPVLGRWQLRGCVGVDLGDLVGAGQGVDHARTIHARFSALAAGLTLRYGQRALGPIVGVEGGVPFERPPFGVSVNGRETETFQQDRFNVRGTIGLSYTL